MKNKTDKIRIELDELINSGLKLLQYFEEPLKLSIYYHEFYTRSLVVLRNLLPDRLMEFERLYHMKERKDFDITTYTIEDYLNGIKVGGGTDNDSKHITTIKIINQINILKSSASRLDDILANIQGTLQADLFDSEIDEARD